MISTRTLLNLIELPIFTTPLVNPLVFTVPLVCTLLREVKEKMKVMVCAMSLGNKAHHSHGP